MRAAQRERVVFKTGMDYAHFMTAAVSAANAAPLDLGDKKPDMRELCAAPTLPCALTMWRVAAAIRVAGCCCCMSQHDTLDVHMEAFSS